MRTYRIIDVLGKVVGLFFGLSKQENLLFVWYLQVKIRERNMRCNEACGEAQVSLLLLKSEFWKTFGVRGIHKGKREKMFDI